MKRVFYPVIVVFLFIVFSGTIKVRSAEPIHKDPRSMVKAGRFQDAIDYFKNRYPNDVTQQMLYARSLEETLPNTKNKKGERMLNEKSLMPLLIYASILGAECKKNPTELEFIGCLDRVSEESRGALLSRLAVYRAALLCERLDAKALRIKFLSLADLSINDPLSHKIYIERLRIFIEINNHTAASALALRYQKLEGALEDYWRAKAMLKSENKKRALEFYNLSASNTSTGWILKAIYQDLKLYFPEMIGAPAKNDRLLTTLVDFLSSDEKKTLVAATPPSFIIDTVRARSLRADGIYLIEIKEENSILPLANVAYTHLSQEPDILNVWGLKLLASKNYRVAKALFDRFPHVRGQARSTWRTYIEILRVSEEKEAYFNELLQYLKYHTNDLSAQDLLISFLIGDNSKKIEWADDAYWSRAASTLPDKNGKGRFVYWLKRYYEKNQNKNELNNINENFYKLMPGSYYARALWDESGSSGNYIADWSRVYNRAGYLWWISKHGGNEKAVRYIAGSIPYAYLDPAGSQLSDKLRSYSPSLSKDMIELFQIGETGLGMDFFEHYYGGRLSRSERYMHLSRTGEITGNLYLSVYYTKLLLREYGVSEDPFSLPPYLLKLLYPRPYLEQVEHYSKINRIEPEMIYALMRQESLFKERAVSRSGATGLMQIMPATGAWLGQKMKIKNYDLTDPDISIKMGTKFFADLIRSYQGDFRWASIAYNGGPGNLRNWKAKYYHGDFNHFLESLPVEESRNYCRITYENYMHYRVAYIFYR